MSYTVSVLNGSRDQLGESPVWDERQGDLVHVDIPNGLVHVWRRRSAQVRTRRVADEVSAVVLRRSGAGMVAACGLDLRLFGDDNQRALATIHEEIRANRLNDCRADPQGRLWAGTMSRARTPATAGLYRLEPGRPIERVLAGCTISNGIGWSPDGERMLYIDSTTQQIDVFDFDGASGAVSGRRRLAAIDRDDGLPDGLAVDAEDGAWVCLFGGGVVRRYDRDGRLDEEIPLPVTNPTCPTFGGPELTTLFITSARHRLSPDQLRAEPAAGSVLAIELGIAGLPANRYDG